MPDTQAATAGQTLRSALFVDFDNIYIGLQQGMPEAAQRFARNPERWLSWLESNGLPEAGTGARRVLVRRCYLNPRRFNDFRPYFIRSAFEVVDCPPLTTLGKTSADILMVLDLVDALNHPTRFDEFILLSGDADFRPVLLRLRQHDRRTTVLTVGNTAAAYRSASDLMIQEETFIEQALQVKERTVVAVPSPEPGAADPALLEAIAHRVHDEAAMTGSVEAWQLPGIYKEFPEFTRGENWLGHYSLKALTAAVVEAHDGLALTDDEDWRVEVRTTGGDHRVPQVETGDREVGPDTEDGEISAFVRRTVAGATAPVPLATLAQQLMDRFGEEIQNGGWQGAGSFKVFLERLDLGGVEISTAQSGLAYDPAVHGEVVEEERRDRFAEEQPELAEFARAVSDITDTPYLSPREYAVLLEEIAREVNEDGYQLTRTSKAVRDRCNGKGISVSRSDVGFLLKGLNFSGYQFEPGEETARSVGQQVVLNTLQLARRSQMEMGEEDEEKVLRWILGSLRRHHGGATPPPRTGEAATARAD